MINYTNILTILNLIPKIPRLETIPKPSIKLDNKFFKKEKLWRNLLYKRMMRYNSKQNQSK